MRQSSTRGHPHIVAQVVVVALSRIGLRRAIAEAGLAGEMH